MPCAARSDGCRTRRRKHMAIKMRVLHDSKKKGMAQLAAEIKAKYDLPVNAVDGKFPPAYSCDKERLVILILNAKNEINDTVRLFCAELNKSRAYNVAVLVDGNQAAADKLTEIITAAGTNFLGAKVISFGGFGPFGGGLTDALKTELMAWVEDMIAACK